MNEQNLHKHIDSRDAEFAKKLGMRLQQLRWNKDLTQEVVAQLAGISTFTYQKFEKGESNPGTPMNPRLFTLLALADVFDMSLLELLDIDGTLSESPQEKPV